MIAAISRISGSSIPRVAGPGVPTLMPEGAEAGFGSKGTWFLFSAMLLCGATGCVERRMVIIAEPYPGAANAIVYDEKGQPIGGTPVDKPFTYYGKYRFRIVKDGFEPLDVEQRVRAPWY